MHTDHKPYDYIGVGIGPSNLALLIALGEAGHELNGEVLEAKSEFAWHPGMMLEGAKMQISFLKDLVTLRNPCSEFSFVSYLKENERLARFINLAESKPSRREFQDYLRWVSIKFSANIRYGCDVKRVSPNFNSDNEAIESFDILYQNGLGQTTVKSARSVVVAPGGRPNLLENVVESSNAVIHSSEFLSNFPKRYPDRLKGYHFGIVGSGQSAAEIASWILERYPSSRVDLVISGFALRPSDESAFANEIFDQKSVDLFRDMPSSRRSQLHSAMRNTNYGVVNEDLIQSLYRTVYDEAVSGEERLFIHRLSRLSAAVQSGDQMVCSIESPIGSERKVNWDGLVLATGYKRSFDYPLFEELMPYLVKDDAGRPKIDRNHRLELATPAKGAVYVQGFAEEVHGLGDTLLSLLPFRSAEIASDMAWKSLQGRPHHIGGLKASAKEASPFTYPPQRHVETSTDRLHEVITRFPFATLISVDGEPVVSHAPLILDLAKGAHGVLRGHIDRSNPQARLMADREILVIFHGPNSYIVPTVYDSDQLPTWNSVSVHAKGTVKLVYEEHDLLSILYDTTEHAEPERDGYRLDKDDKRIAQLIDYIVGFEIEISTLEGRFKLSQDRHDVDRQLALAEMERRALGEQRKYFESIMLNYGASVQSGVIAAE